MTFLALIPAWCWRWISIATVAAAAGAACYIAGVRHEEKLFDEYKGEVKIAADKQAFLVDQTIKAHQALKEISDAEAKNAALQRDAAVLRMRQLVQAGRDRSLLPAQPAGAPGGERVCYAREELDRGLRAALGRLYERVIANAEEGQRAVDVMTVCRTWAAGLSKGDSP